MCFQNAKFQKVVIRMIFTITFFKILRLFLEISQHYSLIFIKIILSHEQNSMRIKFCGLIFHVFDWQEYLWGIYFRDHGSVVGTIVVGFAKYASYCGLSFMDKRHTTKSIEIYVYIPRKFLCVQYVCNLPCMFCLQGNCLVLGLNC